MKRSVAKIPVAFALICPEFGADTYCDVNSDLSETDPSPNPESLKFEGLPRIWSVTVRKHIFIWVGGQELPIWCANGYIIAA
jgi:hypothetical protein